MTEVLQLFLATENFVAIAVGVIIGVTVGSIPGLTATMAVALALIAGRSVARFPICAIWPGWRARTWCCR